MRKIIYLFLSILATSIALSSCKGSGNDPVDPPAPPQPPVEDVLSEEALLGTWETYYYEKQVTLNPGPNQESYGQLRYIDYDGFRSEFSKVGNKYITRDYNLVGDIVYEADYYVKDDTIKFEMHVETEDGRDSIAESWQRVRQFSPEKGIIKLDKSYTGTTTQNDAFYKITDAKIARNIKTAPTTTEYVIPKKHIIDYDDLCKGRWQIYLVREFEDGIYQLGKSEESTKKMNTVSYKFFVNENGKKRCYQRLWDAENNKFIEYEFRVEIIDDVIHLLAKTEAIDEDGNIIKDEEGNIVYEDYNFYIWVTEWAQREGTDSFIDFSETRYVENVRVKVKTLIYTKRVPE